MIRSSKFDKIIAFDCETSGINRKSEDPSDGYQMVSAGIIIADTKEFKPIEKLYLEIKWNGEAKWEEEAEKVHGFSKQYLEKTGVSEEEAAEQIGLLIDRHFGIDYALNFLGHNVHRFDIPFIKRLFDKYEIPFRIAHRHVDTFSLAMPTIGAFDTNKMFAHFGMEERKAHNSMEDIEQTLKVCRLISKMWKQAYQ